jgi:thymidylate synthase (FAD)
MKNFPEFGAEVSDKLIQYLINADHTKVFEHIVLGIQVTGMSRSLLQQNITHRTWSCTSSSQHYQDYRDMPTVIDTQCWNNDEQLALEGLIAFYEALIARGKPKEEARQALPNACAVNQVITTNLRCLINFFTLRCCNRNVKEMRIFAQKMLKLVRAYFPEFANCMGPQCIQVSGCWQGKMQCEQGYWQEL